MFPMLLCIQHILTESGYCNKSECKAMPLLTDPEGFRRLRLPDFKTIGTWRWQGCQPYAPAAFTPRKYSWYSFLLGLSRPQGHSATGRIMSIKISNDTIGNRTRDLPVCSAVTQPLRRRTPVIRINERILCCNYGLVSTCYRVLRAHKTWQCFEILM
jgi:hypothetical protein